MSEKTILLPPPSDMTLLEIVEQLESCAYRCEAGRLELNIAWIELRRRAEREQRTDQSITMASELFEAALDYYDGKIGYDALKARLAGIVGVERS